MKKNDPEKYIVKIYNTKEEMYADINRQEQQRLERDINALITNLVDNPFLSVHVRLAAETISHRVREYQKVLNRALDAEKKLRDIKSIAE